MEVRVLNTNFEAVAIVDRFASLIWTDRYIGFGDFEIYTSVNDNNALTLQQEYYLETIDSEHVMIVEGFIVESDVENGNYLTIKGRSLESILERRIVWIQTILTGDLQTAIFNLLYDNAIAPTDPDRVIPNLVFSASVDPLITELTIDTQYTGTTLYEAILSICTTNNIGFKITLVNGQFVFSLYAGANRAYDQMVNPYVVFSPNFENLSNSNYAASNKTLKNVTLVAGEGEGALRVLTAVGASSGLSRRELYTDARDLRATTDGVTLTPEEYIALLQQRGFEKLALNVAVESFEGTADTTRMFKYGVDFFLGDIVHLINEYGQEGKTRVTEVVYSESESEVVVVPTFSTVT